MADVRPGSTVNAFTVDVEDYFHVSGFADRIRATDWDSFQSRVVRNTRVLLRMLEPRGIRGTFFILGWVARRHPAIVREIDRAGHEIGCHSEWHRLIYDLTPDEFRADTRAARDMLQDLVGRPVTSYRAPSFSITERSLWALDILAEEGFTLDASIYPIRHDRYGIPDANPEIHRRFGLSGSPPSEGGAGGVAFETSDNHSPIDDQPRRPITEFPSSTCRLLRQNLPVGGGGYLRLYPYWLTAAMLRRINRVDRRPFMVYVHPWEVDPDQPQLPGSPLSRFRHYQNLHQTMPRLERLFDEFRFDTASSVADQWFQAEGRSDGIPARHPHRASASLLTPDS